MKNRLTVILNSVGGMLAVAALSLSIASTAHAQLVLNGTQLTDGKGHGFCGCSGTDCYNCVAVGGGGIE
ncbi:MAG TPA: hypothetical protein VHA33_19975 [Candidatus Angelobacter sp.]|jgi:hypothetical protein|nr:hypothetical protein [Candidatus Angelobacter sp.]